MPQNLHLLSPMDIGRPRNVHHSNIKKQVLAKETEKRREAVTA